MRFLSFHVDYFWYHVTQKGRSKVVEGITEANQECRVEDALVLFISMEKQDEGNPKVIDNAVTEIGKISDQLKVHTIVLNPFAHLFGELSSLEYAQRALVELAQKLETRNFYVVRIPFGWFNELEMKAKGHPLSRIARIIE